MRVKLALNDICSSVILLLSLWNISRFHSLLYCNEKPASTVNIYLALGLWLKRVNIELPFLKEASSSSTLWKSIEVVWLSRKTFYYHGYFMIHTLLSCQTNDTERIKKWNCSDFNHRLHFFFNEERKDTLWIANCKVTLAERSDVHIGVDLEEHINNVTEKAIRSLGSLHRNLHIS